MIDLGARYKDVKISLVNIEGRVISKIGFTKEAEQVELEFNSPAGVYFIQIQTKSGEIALMKLVKI